MNAEGHLFVSGVLNIIFLGILYLLGVNVFQIDILFPVLIVFGIFSLLPDIDHSRSKISGLLQIAMVLIIIYSLITFFLASKYFNLVFALLAVIVLKIHSGYAEDSYDHRKFPHTITFSFISCIVLFFLSYLTLKNNANTLILTGIGTISVFSHIWADEYMYETFMLFKNKKNYLVNVTNMIALDKQIPSQFNALILRTTQKSITFKLLDSGKKACIPKSQIEYLQCLSDYNSPVIINSYDRSDNSLYEYNNEEYPYEYGESGGDEIINQNGLGYEDIKEIIYVFIQSEVEPNLFFEDIVQMLQFGEVNTENALNDLIQEGRIRLGANGFYST